MGKIFPYDFFNVCEKFHRKNIICSIFFGPFDGIAKMWQGFANQNNTLLDYYVIHICIDFTT
jgi:hypothetical protein